MKAQEIRGKELIHHLGADSKLASQTIANSGSVLDCAYFLQEIAAQFADLNERLDGFMGSMVQLAKAINELNAELLKSGKAEKQLLDGIHKWIGSLRVCGSKDPWETGYDRAIADVKREFGALFMPTEGGQ